jgi:ribosome biogenesis protein SSF1/2
MIVSKPLPPPPPASSPLVLTVNTPPLVVLNAFGQSDQSHVKLMKATFQNMFPTINTKTVKLSECKRVVLFHYKKEVCTDVLNVEFCFKSYLLRYLSQGV